MSGRFGIERGVGNAKRDGGGKPVDLKLDIVNAFDARYRLSDGTAFGGGVPQWGTRRGIFIGAEQNF